eukprot:scaffold101_cov373-Prasinococcus_capsulatus_cf.AAC.5
MAGVPAPNLRASGMPFMAAPATSRLCPPTAEADNTDAAGGAHDAAVNSDSHRRGRPSAAAAAAAAAGLLRRLLLTRGRRSVGRSIDRPGRARNVRPHSAASPSPGAGRCRVRGSRRLAPPGGRSPDCRLSCRRWQLRCVDLTSGAMDDTQGPSPLISYRRLGPTLGPCARLSAHPWEGRGRPRTNLSPATISSARTRPPINQSIHQSINPSTHPSFVRSFVRSFKQASRQRGPVRPTRASNKRASARARMPLGAAGMAPVDSIRRRGSGRGRWGPPATVRQLACEARKQPVDLDWRKAPSPRYVGRMASGRGRGRSAPEPAGSAGTRPPRSPPIKEGPESPALTTLAAELSAPNRPPPPAPVAPPSPAFPKQGIEDCVEPAVWCRSRRTPEVG